MNIDTVNHTLLGLLAGNSSDKEGFTVGGADQEQSQTVEEIGGIDINRETERQSTPQVRPHDGRYSRCTTPHAMHRSSHERLGEAVQSGIVARCGAGEVGERGG